MKLFVHDILVIMTNFDFLKSIDKNLFEIAKEAEKLYADEYFEQCMTQTRRLGENICRAVLKDAVQSTDTFDDMIELLKDKASGSIREKEFIEDLYFLKRAGNVSTHSASVKKDGLKALECLQRAFEACINYAIAKKGPDSKIAALCYDEELLVTGKRGSANKNLKQRYLEKKETVKNTVQKRTKSKAIASRKSVVQEEKLYEPSELVAKIKRFLMVVAFWGIMIFGVAAYISRIMQK